MTRQVTDLRVHLEVDNASWYNAAKLRATAAGVNNRSNRQPSGRRATRVIGIECLLDRCCERTRIIHGHERRCMFTDRLDDDRKVRCHHRAFERHRLEDRPGEPFDSRRHSDQIRGDDQIRDVGPGTKKPDDIAEAVTGNLAGQMLTRPPWSTGDQHGEISPGLDED